MPQPFIKFYFADWEGDAQLMGCSLAAQGLWIRMMRVMHEANPYGHFVGREGEPINPKAFARRIGSSTSEVRRLVAEMENEHVFSRNEAGTIFSRRMLRDREKMEQATEYGRKGGNPALKSSASEPLTLGDNTLYARIPEAQKPRDTSSLRSDAAQPPKSTRKPPDTAWVAPLREHAKALAGRAIGALTPTERLVLARYHCLQFANCTKSEAANKAKATNVAGAFASMGRNKTYGDMTVAEYVGYAKQVHKNREETPFFDPWLIKGVVEFESGAA